MSVANLTRADAHEFLEIAPKAGVHCEVTRYPLARANEALSDLRDGRLQGAAVLSLAHSEVGPSRDRAILGSAWPITRLIDGERCLQGALQRVDLFVHGLHAQGTGRRGSGN